MCFFFRIALLRFTRIELLAHINNFQARLVQQQEKVSIFFIIIYNEFHIYNGTNVCNDAMVHKLFVSLMFIGLCVQECQIWRRRVIE